MGWLTEHPIWVLMGLIAFMAIWFVAFFVRNQQAKKDQDTNLHGDNKQAGTAPVKQSSKL